MLNHAMQASNAKVAMKSDRHNCRGLYFPDSIFRMSRYQNGLTLIEVLIALLVLSLGLAGIAVLHINSIKFAHSSYYSSIASSVALDLEERLWIELRGSSENCVTVGQVDEVISSLESQWSGTGAGQIVIPGLSIERGTIDSGSLDSPWTGVPITISWADGRFDGAEAFSYTARVLCYQSDEDDD